MALFPCLLAVAGAASLSAARPDTPTRVDTSYARPVITDTLQETTFTSVLTADRHIRLSVSGAPVGTPIVTGWLDTGAVRQWLDVIDTVLAGYGSVGTRSPGDSTSSGTVGVRTGHVYALGGAVAVTPYALYPAPLYKIDVADTSLDRTATLGVSRDQVGCLAYTLQLAVTAARVLRDDELRRGGPLAVHVVRLPPATSPPTYPQYLREILREGAVDAQFTVDTAGRVDMSTFRAITSDHPEFTRVVRVWLRHVRYSPFSIEGHIFEQRVRQVFDFTFGPREMPLSRTCRLSG